MNKLKFAKDEGLLFYKELNQKVDAFFIEHNIKNKGHSKMIFKIFFYFGLDIMFYGLMISSNDILSFYCYYLLMGLFVLLTAFNISPAIQQLIFCHNQ